MREAISTAAATRTTRREDAGPQTPAPAAGRRRGSGDAAGRTGRVGAGVGGGGVRRGIPVGGRVRFGHTRKVSDDVATETDRDGRAEVRRRRVTMAGHRGDAALARRGLADPDQGVQVAALGALARLGALTAADVESALADGTPALRRRAVEAAPAARGTGTRSSLPRAVTGALGDADPLVVVGAAWFLAERARPAGGPAAGRDRDRARRRPLPRGGGGRPRRHR